MLYSTSSSKEADTINVLSPPMDTVSDIGVVDKFIAVSSWDKSVRIYQITKTVTTSYLQKDSLKIEPFKLFNNAEVYDAPVVSVDISLNGFFVCGLTNGKIIIQDIADENKKQIFKDAHQGIVKTVKIIKNGNIVSCGLEDGTIKMWSMSACLGEVKTNSKIYAMDIYNEHLVAGLADKTIKYVNLNTNDMKVIRPDNLDHNIRSISVTVDSGYNAPPLVSVGDVVGKVMIVNIMSDKTENNVKLHRIDKKCYATNKVGFVPDKTNIVVSGGSDGKFVIFNRNRRLNVYSNSFNSPISDLRVTKDCIVFATGYDWSKGYQSNVSPIEIKFIDSSKLKLE